MPSGAQQQPQRCWMAGRTTPFLPSWVCTTENQPSQPTCNNRERKSKLINGAHISQKIDNPGTHRAAVNADEYCRAEDAFDQAKQERLQRLFPASPQLLVVRACMLSACDTLYSPRPPPGMLSCQTDWARTKKEHEQQIVHLTACTAQTAAAAPTNSWSGRCGCGAWLLRHCHSHCLWPYPHS